MGGILTLPISLVAAVSKKGITYCINYATFYIYLITRNTFRKKRFDLYDFERVGQPEVNGFLTPKIEWILDPPSKCFPLEKNPDDVFIYGTNSKSEYLLVYIQRLPDNQVRSSLFFRTLDGKLYSLPKEHAVQEATSEDNTFGSSRLKLQCLIPMRKWRIFFNGILQEHTINENSNSYKHSKFSFIWTASAEIFDFSSDLPNSTFSHVAASLSWLTSPKSFISKMRQTFDWYEQPGMILGTITIEDEPEKELYFWGGRQRFMAKNGLFKQENSIELYGTFRNGMEIHLIALNSSDKVKRLNYGFIMKTNGFVFPIDQFDGDVEAMENGKLDIKCHANNQWYSVKVKSIGDNSNFSKEQGTEYAIQITEMTLDEKLGKGFILKANHLNQSEFFRTSRPSQQNPLNSTIKSKNTLSALCLPFDDILCQRSELSGGKGSSLGHLYGLSTLSTDNGLAIKFFVPKGLVVTTASYEEFINGPLEKSLKNFEKYIWASKGDTMPLCQNIVQVVGNTTLPDTVSNAIVKSLNSIFGENISDRKFAVRSSATGEDTEQMSAAGQMETFLGVKGVDKILKAVTKCWGSQFSFQAVEYKRGYGQRINTPMAVVIQEMVHCEVAGVIFTCDPVTGNPSFINITANYGLGESVVSASADPDTVTLSRNIDSNLTFHSKQIGTKMTKIIMDGDSGTKEIETDDTDMSNFCLSDYMALKLGKLAVEIEKYYGTPRDIEWGIADDKVFLFQSRPLTSLDMDTDFEIKHSFDSYQRTEKSFWSKANVGEVLPGATSPLALDLLQRIFDLVYRRRSLKLDEGMHPQKPYFQKSLTYAFGQVFINLLSGQFRFGKDNDEADTKGFMISLFGRLLPEEIGLLEEATLVPPPPIPRLKKVVLILHFLYLCFLSGIVLRRGTKRIVDFSIPYKGLKSSEILQKIAHNYDLSVQAMSLHLNCTFSSSFWNMSMLSLLVKARGDWDNVAFSDFAYLLSTCDGVESATIPAAIQDIGNNLSKEIDVDVFKNMSVKEALEWLNNNLGEAGAKFREFLQRHGHRCLKEFDVYTETWGSDPTPVIKMLQKFVNKNTEHSAVKEADSFSTVLSKLQVQLNFKERLHLRWLLPNARRGVRERENAKSLYILSHNALRKPFRGLADVMVAEGRLPRKELLFFLCVDEIQQLIQTRSPRLVAKAMRRFKVHKELDELKFPEICDGIPKPINEKDDIPLTGKGLKMTGVPVSQGIIKAPARVVMNLDEAKTIQQGDVLITYSTDIGWSPYFPLLSGVVTELGGLISHGAVVAREYGLPCVVGLHGATRAFKSGDLVILDGTRGILQKVEEDSIGNETE